MILNADPVQAARLDLAGEVKQRIGGIGNQEISERQIAAVVRHLYTLSPLGRSRGAEQRGSRLLARRTGGPRQEMTPHGTAAEGALRAAAGTR